MTDKFRAKCRDNKAPPIITTNKQIKTKLEEMKNKADNVHPFTDNERFTGTEGNEANAQPGRERRRRRPGDGLETRRNRAETGPRPGRRPGRLRQWEMGPDGVVREQPVAAMGDPLGAIEVSPGGNRGRGTVRPLAPGETGARPGVEIVRGRPGRARG